VLSVRKERVNIRLSFMVVVVVNSGVAGNDLAFGFPWLVFSEMDRGKC